MGFESWTCTTPDAGFFAAGGVPTVSSRAGSAFWSMGGYFVGGLVTICVSISAVAVDAADMPTAIEVN